MSDDSFIREVNEELRQEKARALWGRYGPFLIGLAVFLVLATGVYQFFQYWQSKKADRISQDYVAALDLSDQRHFDEAIQKLDETKATGFGVYPVLADMRKAAILSEQGKSKEAVALFDTIAADTKTPETLRQVAQIRAAYILVDEGTFEEVSSRVDMFANEVNPMRMSAWEALGLAAWKAGKTDEAKTYFNNILTKGVPYTLEAGVPNASIINRTQLMLELINSGVTTPGS